MSTIAYAEYSASYTVASVQASRSGTAAASGSDGKSAALREALAEGRKAAVAERKRFATERLELARKTMRALRMLGGDPRLATRQARHIAHEIRTAAKTYASALQEEGTTASAFKLMIDVRVGEASASRGDGGQSLQAVEALIAGVVESETDGRKTMLLAEVKVLSLFVEGANEAMSYFDESRRRVQPGQLSSFTVQSAGKAVSAMFESVRDLAGSIAGLGSSQTAVSSAAAYTFDLRT